LLLLCGVALVGLVSPAKAYLYWTQGPNSSSLARANLDGTGVEPRFLASVRNGGVAVDGAHIYYDTDAGIARANLDGSGVDDGFITGAGGTIAVDGAHIYWTGNANTTGRSAIGRANLDGSGVDQSFITITTGLPRGVASDGVHLYWTDSSGRGIGRANVDGTAADPSFIATAGGTAPGGGIAVDGTHIYWNNDFHTRPGLGRPGAVARANLDGSGVEPRFITGVSEPGGGPVVDQEGHIYWTTARGYIGRANVDGTGVDQSFITNLSLPALDLAVDDLGPPAPPAPEFGSTATVQSVSGVVSVQLPGTDMFVPLSGSATLPLGVLVDTTSGRVRLSSATGASGGGAQSVLLNGTTFRVSQTRARSPFHKGRRVGFTVLTLAGEEPSGCASGTKAGTARRKPPGLYADGHGDHATKGHHGISGSGGTRWFTQETCDGTLFKVRRGVISVRDFTLHHTVLVRAPHSYLARARRRK
jgi:hypothetical protein